MTEMKKSVIIVILTTLLAIVIIPLCIDWCVIGNRFPSNISNSDWVGFLGGYIGAIIGSVTSLIGIVITIRYTNTQNRLDRELQVRPYCSIRYVHEDKLHGTNKIIGNYLLACEPYKSDGPRYTSILYIKNVGMGPALDFEFETEEIDDSQEKNHITPQRAVTITREESGLLQAGEEGALPIMIWFNFDPVQDKDIIDHGEGAPSRYDVVPSVMAKYRNFSIFIKIKYCDMFRNQYMQEVALYASMHMSFRPGKRPEHGCDVYMRDVSVPTKVGVKH